MIIWMKIILTRYFKSQKWCTNFFNNRIARKLAHWFDPIASRAISNIIIQSSEVPKSTNETRDPEICGPFRSSVRQTSFYVTSWDNRCRSDAASRLPSAGRKKRKKKGSRSHDPDKCGRTCRQLNTRLRRSNRVSVTLTSRDVDARCYYLRNYLTIVSAWQWSMTERITSESLPIVPSSDVIPKAPREKSISFFGPMYFWDCDGKL